MSDSVQERAHILVGSGDADMRLLLKTAIENAGLRASVVSSRKEAVSRAAGLSPDVLVLDTDLPGMRADEVAKHLHTLNATRDLPVLFLLNGTFHPGKMQGFRLGMDQVLQKPFDLARLISAFNGLGLALSASATA